MAPITMPFITIKKFLYSRIRFLTVPFIRTSSSGTRLKTSPSFIDEKFKQIDKSPFLTTRESNFTMVNFSERLKTFA